MKLDSVRSLKLELIERVVMPAVTRALSMGAFAVSARATGRMSVPRALALGVARGRAKGEFALAVRVQRGEAWALASIRTEIERRARREVDVREVGHIYKAATWEQRRHRPLRIGTSIGHHAVTAGTLGCVVRDAKGRLGVLSNNHVLANENAARRGDAILQPGSYDGGVPARDTVAALERFVRIRTDRTNFVDAAFALLAETERASARSIRGVGTFAGLAADPAMPGDRVRKVGRTTGLRQGRVTAIELDQVVVGFDFGNARFDDQIEIEGTGTTAFSAGGDSGSVIVNDDRAAVALLFAGSDSGGANGQGLTYANPISEVLRRLRVSIVT